jgi:hypothetical protein
MGVVSRQKEPPLVQIVENPLTNEEDLVSERLEEFDNFMDVDIALFYPKANGK